MDNSDPTPETSWLNVAIASLLVFITIALSVKFELNLSRTIVIASTRCALQLSLLGLVLEPVLSNDSPLYTFALSGVLVLLSAVEISLNKSKIRYDSMFGIVLISIALSCGLVGFVGNQNKKNHHESDHSNAFAIQATPWYRPRSFIPILGMLLGNSMNTIAVAQSHFLTQITTNQDRVEMYLAFGASRWEAALPIMRESLRLALLPTLNQMSTLGLISIPGMMTGQILGGAPVGEAARYQMIIMFLITAASSMASLMALLACVRVAFDEQSRLRLDRLHSGSRHKPGEHATLVRKLGGMAANIFAVLTCHTFDKPLSVVSERSEHQPLLRSG
ncbi:hypothetical protein BJ742DRAFT_677199 [Cladochytrium replicatum]|nr:hypothetical protein BJ742DRAFT_677199 [Cladochytrium replicatum]